MERCPEYVIALLAILKTGAAYTPVELAYPAPLLSAVLQDVTPCVVLTKAVHESNLPANTPTVNLDEGWLGMVDGVSLDVLLDHRPDKESLCYVIYSGGSTGKPKGIEAQQRSPVASYLSRFAISGYQPGSRVACNVFFVWECVRPLLRGGAVVVVPDDIVFQVEELAKYLETKRVTEMLFTPSLLETLLGSVSESTLQSLDLQVVYLNGEVVTTKLLQACLFYMPNVRFVNTYSISECGEVCCTILDPKREEGRKFCTVGPVIKGSFPKHYIMAEDEGIHTPVERGLEGELWVAGPGVGKGYLKNPEATAKRFPSRDGERFYRTGDLARELEDGNVEILGRCDFMVKVRGYSIVLEAVEAIMFRRLGITRCIVSALGAEGEDKRLVAYLEPCQPDQIERRFDVLSVEVDKYGRSHALYEELLRELPHYSTPSTFVIMKEGLPINQTSMKADRKNLPAAPVLPPAAELPPNFAFTGSEEDCRILMEHILAVAKGSLTMTSNFFALGGHSLMTSRLLAKVKEFGGPSIPTVDFLKQPTPGGLYAVCRGDETSAANLHHLPKEVQKYLDADGSDIDLNVRAFWRYIVFTNSSARIMLTGATGYVGAFILRELLEKTESQVFCLVRVSSKCKDPEAEARQRIVDNCRQHGISIDDSRVIALPGDVSLPQLGLGSDEYHYLQQLVDIVVHSAAMVNLVYPYDLLENVNVAGTARVIEFARSGKVKALHYVSTNGIFPEEGETMSFKEETVPPHHKIMSGYGQTKWVAEQLVRKAMELGLPGAVYRLGNVGGPTEGRGWNSQDSNLLFMRRALQCGKIPEEAWAIEYTPVDFVAGFMVKSMLDLENTNHKTFHLINPARLDLQVLTQVASRVGFPLTAVSAATWCASLDADTADSWVLAYPNLQLLLEQHHQYSQENTQAACERFQMEYPAPTPTLLYNTLRRLANEGLLPKPQAAVGRLANQVAIVTGASSGIGLAICQSLQAEGVTVVMAARNLGRLEEAAKSVPDAVLKQVDVIKRGAVQGMVDQVKEELGRVDILVNCAGVMYFTMMKNLHYDEWEQMIDINCKGVVNTCGAVFPIMLEAKTGHIVNISSDAAKTIFPALSVYNASKAFVAVFTKGLRAECVGTGLRVTDIQPGDTATNLILKNSDAEAAEKLGVGIGKVVGGEGADRDRNMVLDPADVASAVIYAVTAPPHVGVHEILIEPRDQMFGDPTAMN